MASIAKLSHIRRPLPRGGQIFILNTGAVIGPEAEAMLQALHSRSPKGVDDHLEVLVEKGSDGFMGVYYVGYGHKSIGDCGSATVFIEGVSMFVAKAIQDSMLYNGQECSTRYIDFATQRFIDPVGTGASNAILEKWRGFYVDSKPKLNESLKVRFPRVEGEEKKGVYEKAIDARTFDILRGFLPAGASTNLAWHTNLRQFADRLAILRNHPLIEVRNVAWAIEDGLLEAFPNSFGLGRHKDTEIYNRNWLSSHYYLVADSSYPNFELSYDGINYDLLAEYGEVLRKRPVKTELPKFVGECGTLRFKFLIDFGSFRDIQRHRAVIQRMPLVTTTHGFNPWYLEELPENLREETIELLARQLEDTNSLKQSPEITQYYLPMGYNLPCALTGDLPSLVYLVELRGTRFVHPTLVRVARKMADALKECLGQANLILHMDEEPGRFDIRRGEQDIVRKDE